MCAIISQLTRCSMELPKPIDRIVSSSSCNCTLIAPASTINGIKSMSGLWIRSHEGEARLIHLKSFSPLPESLSKASSIANDVVVSKGTNVWLFDIKVVHRGMTNRSKTDQRNNIVSLVQLRSYCTAVHNRRHRIDALTLNSIARGKGEIDSFEVISHLTRDEWPQQHWIKCNQIVVK